MFKRFIAIFLVVALCFSVQGGVFASDRMSLGEMGGLDALIGTTATINPDIVFDNSLDDGLSDIERGLARVKSVSSFVSGKSLSDKQLEFIGKSDSASMMTLYYIEELNTLRSGEVTSRMAEVSESEYFSELEGRTKTLPHTDKMVNVYDPNNSKPTRAYDEFDVDGGLLQMHLILYYSGSTLADIQYVADAAFGWDSMPVKRQVDVFGISRGYNTVTYGDFSAYTKVYKHTWQGIANSPYLPYDESASGWVTSSPSNDATNDYHYAFKYLLPTDLNPLQVLQGTWAVITKHEALYGECSYTGTMDHYSYIPGGVDVINFNNWATYAHSNGFMSISLSFGANVSYPTNVSAGFSVEPSWVNSFITNRLTHTTRVTIS